MTIWLCSATVRADDKDIRRIVNWEPVSIRDDIAQERLQSLPFTFNKVTLDNDQSVTLLLRSNRHLFVQFLDEDEEPVPATSKAINTDTGEPYQLRLLLSETPGMAQQFSARPDAPYISAAPQDRIVTLTNKQSPQQSLRLFIGQEQRLADFAPLSWLQAEEAERHRIASSDHQFHDFSALAGDHPITLEKDTDYWIEAVSDSSGHWQQARTSYLHLSSQEKPNQLRTLFENRTPKLLLLPDTHADNQANIRLHPAVVSTSGSADTRLSAIAPTLLRAQSLDEDWLFNSNYQSLSTPAVEQQKQLNRFTASLSTPSETMERAPVIANSDNHRVFNRWLAEKSMPVESRGQIEQLYLTTLRQKWELNDEISNTPDKARQEVVVTSQPDRDAFTLLTPHHSLHFRPPHDQLSNRVAIELAIPRTAAEHSRFEIWIDGHYHTTLRTFTNAEMDRYAVATDWSLHPKDKAAQHAEHFVARKTLYLPDNWQHLSLTATAGNPVVRVRYQIAANQRLDGPQWQHWLFDEDSQKNQGAATSQRIIEQHPQWLAFQQHQDIRQQQFLSQDIPLFWQQWLQAQRFPEGFFTQPVPDSLPALRAIQAAFLAPQLMQWQWWSNLYEQFQQAGWENYGVSMFKALVLFHPQSSIKEKAADQLLEQYHAQGNLAEQSNLLTTVMRNTEFPDSTRESARLALASLYLINDRPDFALFLLKPAKNSEKRATIMHQAALRLGFVRLAEAIKQRSPYFKSPAFAGEDTGIAPLSLISGITSGQMLELYNVKLDVPQRNYLVTPSRPLTIAVSGATQLSFTARQWFTEAHQQDDWLTVSHNDVRFKLPIRYSDFRSETLLHHKASVGSGHRFTANVPASGTVTIATSHRPILINLQQLLLQSQQRFVQNDCQRENTQRFQHYWWTPPDSPGFECHYWQLNPAHYQNFHLTTQFTPPLEADISGLLEKTWQFEQEPTHALLTQLNVALAQLPESSFRQRMTRRINQNSEWQPLNFPIQTRKFSFYSTTTNEPLSPDAVRSRLLYTPYKKDWEKLASQSVLNYDLLSKAGETYRILLQAQRHLLARESQSQVTIELDNQLLKKVTLNSGEQKLIELPLEPGQHKLSLASASLDGLSSVIAKLQFKPADGAWQEQPQDIRIRLFQADKLEPYQVFLEQDSWLRIDSFSEQGLVRHQYLYAPSGLFSWYDDASEYAGHRVLRLKLSNTRAQPASTPLLAQTKIAVDLYPAKKLTGQHIINHSKLTEFDTQDGYTWGIEAGIEQRRLGDEDNAQNNRFQQLKLFMQDRDATYRYFYRSQLALRHYNANLQESLHLDLDWWDTQWLEELDLHLGAAFDAQQGATDDNWAWSARLSADMYWQYALNRRLFNRFSFGVFATLIQSGKDPTQYANAVYSQYKLDHRYGVSFSEMLRYKWYHDLESWLELRLTSNELSSDKLLDNGVVQLGSRLYYRGIMADINWRWQKYFSDDSRLNSSIDNRIGAGLEWFSWHEESHLRLRLGFDHNLSNNENYWSINLAWTEAGHSAVDDYQPQSLAFAPLRRQQALLEAQQVQENAQQQN